MTIAICKSCGAKKFGALVQCENCNFEPSTKDDIAESIILSDQYLGLKTLKKISKDFL